MRIFVTGHVQASEYTPTQPTIAIRIHDPHRSELSFNSILKASPLKSSELYIAIHQYVFNDVNPDQYLANDPNYDIEALKRETIVFNEKIARKIITDFQEVKDQCLDLLVHCTIGSKRSPAIAIALNDIFVLGRDSEKMKLKKPNYNSTIYRIMKETAKNMKI